MRFACIFTAIFCFAVAFLAFAARADVNSCKQVWEYLAPPPLSGIAVKSNAPTFTMAMYKKCVLGSSSTGRTSQAFSTARWSGVTTEYDYAEVLRKSLYFYECQRSGKLPPPCPVTNDPNYNGVGCTRPSWRKDSGLGDASYADGRRNNPDLTGGYHDAGDHAKFGLPFAYALGSIALGMLELKAGFLKAGHWDIAKETLKWGTDYLLKAHSSPDLSRLYVQVGDVDADHSACCRPQEMSMPRPGYYVDSSSPGTDVWGASAAALAAGYIIFNSEGQSAYAAQLLTHAQQIYDVAKRSNKRFYHVGIPGADIVYKSYSWADDMGYAAAMLYYATRADQYLVEAKQWMQGSGDWGAVNWDNNQWNAWYVIRKFDASYAAGTQKLDQLFNFWQNNVKYTPKGLAWFSTWGTLRDTAGAAFISMLWANLQADEVKQAQMYCWAQSQIRYMLGDSGRSYVVGFGFNPPVRPHHRSSLCPPSGPCGWDYFNNNALPNFNTLFGALVGGPNVDDSYVDDRKDYTKNEVALDFQSGFQGAIAALLIRRPIWGTTCQCILSGNNPSSCPIQWTSAGNQRPPAPPPQTPPPTPPPPTTKPPKTTRPPPTTKPPKTTRPPPTTRPPQTPPPNTAAPPPPVTTKPPCPQDASKATIILPGFEQCGGNVDWSKFDAPWLGYACASGFTCCRQDEWYYQCKNTPSCAQCPPSGPNPTPAPGGGKVLDPWGQCGGKSPAACAPYTCVDGPWPGTSCPTGFKCVRSDQWYYQCKP